MSEPDRDQEPLDADDDDDDDASSPFDHPAFLPVLLWGLAAWFGYDGWFNENIEAVMFNRYGFAVLVVLGVYFTVQSVREVRADRESDDSAGQ